MKAHANQFFHVKTIRTPRVYFSNNFRDDSSSIWLIFHGYGQLASRFIEKFFVLTEDGSALVVPEAMQRFYLEGNGGKIGSSWMTREDRETDISDNHHYLNKVVSEVKNRIRSEPKWHILAFSQGTATACRWLAQSNIVPESLTLWAGMWPEDVSGIDLSKVLQGVPSFWIIGDDDPYYSSEMLQRQEALLKAWNIFPELITFKGGHHIDEHTLRDLQSRITRR